MLTIKQALLFSCCTVLASHAVAAGHSVTMYGVDATGTTEALGEVELKGNDYGVVFTPQLKGLTPGVHGFHLHEHGDCGAGKDGTPGAGAGGHYDPEDTGKHGAPWSEGHLGDLPALTVSDDGKAQGPVLAPRLTLNDLSGRALMIHSGGDNYSDTPEKLGGGGARVACGVIQ